MDPESGAASRLPSLLDRFPARTLGGLLGVGLLLMLVQAKTRLLWADEVITASIARQGSLGGIWRALAAGADPNPPLVHILVLAAARVFGWSALALRVPSIAAMLLTTVCIWSILRRWVTPSAAAVGVLAFMATRGFDYGYEARSYALLTGCTMAALACWMKTVPGPRHELPGEASSTGGRKGQMLLWVVLCALSLGGAVSSNYYGVLAWFPVAAGEAVRTIRTRSVRAGIWIGLAVAALPLYAYLPLIRHNIAEFTPHAWNRTSFSVVPESYFVLVEGVFWPVLVGGAYVAWRRTRAIRPLGAEIEARQGRGRTVCASEAVALSVLLVYPVLGLALSAVGGGMISARCVLPVCCGFGIAAGLLARRLFDTPRRMTVLLALGLLWVIGRQTACFVLLDEQREAFSGLLGSLEARANAGSSPILVSDSNLAPPLAWYATPELRSRLVFPIDFAAIHRYEADDSGEQNLWAGRYGVFPLQVVPYSPTLVAGNPAFVLARRGGWLARMLAADGLSVRDETTPAELKTLKQLGGVFTPLAHDGTRVLAP